MSNTTTTNTMTNTEKLKALYAQIDELEDQNRHEEVESLWEPFQDLLAQADKNGWDAPFVG